MKTILKVAALSGLIATPALAGSDGTEKLFESAWSGMGFVLGYGDHNAYVKYACGGNDPGAAECDGPPELGMVRKLTGIIDSTVKSLGIATCAAVPTTGTATATVGGVETTVTFATPKLAVPTAWTGGGTAYDRRMEFDAPIAGASIKIALEVSCAHDHTVFVGMNMLVGDHAPGYTRPINVWLGSKDDKSVADIYLAEVNATTQKIRGAYSFGLMVDDTAKTYQIWGANGVHYNESSSDKVADAYNLTGNFSTHAVSLKVKRFSIAGSDDSYNPTVLAALTGANVATLPASTNFDLLADHSSITAGSSYAAQGCMDFDTPTVAPTAATACEGLAWSDAPVPVADSAGSFSPAWIFATMHSKMVEIPSL